jgi:FlaA1/EpsC-like NDP-sugar epimerase
LAFQPIITCTVTAPIVWVPPALRSQVVSSVCALALLLLLYFGCFLLIICYYVFYLLFLFYMVLWSVLFCFLFGCFMASVLLWLLLWLGWFTIFLFSRLLRFPCASSWWLVWLFLCLSSCWWSSLLERALRSLKCRSPLLLFCQQNALGELLDVGVHIFSDELPLFLRPG